MGFLPAFGHLRENLVMRFPNNIQIVQPEHLAEIIAYNNMSHVAIEHGDGDRRMFGKQPQDLFASAQFLLRQFAFGDIFNEALDELRFPPLVADQNARIAHPNHPSIRGDHAVFLGGFTLP